MNGSARHPRAATSQVQLAKAQPMSSDMSASSPLQPDTVARLHAAIMAGHPNGKRLIILRRIEASIDHLTETIDAAVRADEPAALDQHLNLLLMGQRRALQIPDDEATGARFQELFSAWQANVMPEGRRRLFERNLITANIQTTLRATHPELARTLQQSPLTDPAMAPSQQTGKPSALGRIEAAIAKVAEAMDMALGVDEHELLDEHLTLIQVAQARELRIPDGEGAAPRLQELAEAWQANTMPQDQRRIFERREIGRSIRFKLRVTHPELARPPEPPDPNETQLIATIQQLAGPLREAQAHTVAGSVTLDWLDALEGELARHRDLLQTVAPVNKYRAILCYTIAGAAYALGRGYNQMLRPRQARDAYAEAARLYTEGEAPEDAASAAERAAWLTFSLTADIDGGSFDDLRRLADGIADPLDRANALHRLALRAAEANDYTGALRYADAMAAALAEAGFPDPESGTIASVMDAWVAAAINRRTGQGIARLLQRIGDMGLDILTTRLADRMRTNPALARATEETVAQVGAAVRAIVEEPYAVAAEIDDGLLPYGGDAIKRTG